MNYEAFLSYRRENKAAADFIYDYLSKQGHPVFFDTHSLLAGDFTREIRTAIQESELFLSILTDNSLRRMAENKCDMVRLELETAREAQRSILFFYLVDMTDGQDLYQKLACYSGELFDWLRRQNIISFTFDAPSMEEVNRKALCALEEALKKKFEAICHSPRQGAHWELSFNEKTYQYHGTCRFGSFGRNVPYQEGVLENRPRIGIATIYQGTWDGTDDFSGYGSIYHENVRTGQRWRVYQGSWKKLRYHDNDGYIYDEGGECVYHGCLMDGQKVLYGEGILEDGSRFKGWYQDDRPVRGERRYPNGDLYSGQMDKDGNPDGFGRMFYSDGGAYDGNYDHGTLYGYGVLTYQKDGYEIRYQGGFSEGRKRGAHKNEALEIQLRAPGETAMRPVFSSVDCTLSPDFYGVGTFEYADGSVFEGKWSSGKKTSGTLFLCDGQEIKVENNWPVGQEISQAALMKVLEQLDEEWLMQHLLMEDTDEAHLNLLACYSAAYYLPGLHSISPQGCLSCLRERVSQKLEPEQITQTVPDYPYNKSFLHRLAAFAQLKPSLRFRLPQEEQLLMECFIYEEAQKKVADRQISFSRLKEAAEQECNITIPGQDNAGQTPLSRKSNDPKRPDWASFFGVDLQ